MNIRYFVHRTHGCPRGYRLVDRARGGFFRWGWVDRRQPIVRRSRAKVRPHFDHGRRAS